MGKYIALLIVTVASSSVLAAQPRIELGKLGALRVGMSEPQVEKAAGSPLKHEAPEAEEEGCFYATVPTLPAGTSLMFLDRRLARIDVYERGVETVSGAGVGTPEIAVKKLYGARLQQQPHAYDGPTGHYLTLLSRDGTVGVRFETDGTRVTGYYTGTAEAIQLIEGCQ